MRASPRARGHARSVRSASPAGSWQSQFFYVRRGEVGAHKTSLQRVDRLVMGDPGGSLCRRIDAQLAEDRRQVPPRRQACVKEPPRYFMVGKPVADEESDLPLSRGKYLIAVP